MPIKSYQDLKVWQVAMALANDVYTVTAEFPKREWYGLASQVRRAAVSVPSNVAEGHARGSTRDFLRFLAVAQGSLAEVETQLLIAARQGILANEAVSTLLATADEVGKMLRSLRISLKAKISDAPDQRYLPGPQGRVHP